MNDFTPVSAPVGGALIGLSAALFLLTQGKIAGISGLVGGLLAPGTKDRAIRIAFLSGLVLVGIVTSLVVPGAIGAAPPSRTLLVVGLAGLLVGFGTRLGNGCTSGHGVCGISRFSVRSILATVTFIATGALAVALFGGAS